jgi:Fe-S cluster biogenesis protein NfuA
VLILTEKTPNPEALKFVPEQPLTAGDSRWFETGAGAAERSPLAARLFALAGVKSVFVAPGFVTVTRSPDGPPWAELRYAVIAAVADHLGSGEAALAAGEAAACEDDDQVISEIRQVLGLYVRPGVAQDGGDVLFERFDPAAGVLWVRLQGACGGCPSARLTLKAGIEQIVRRYVPEVLRVEETAPADPAPKPARRWRARETGGLVQRARTLFTHAGQEIRR